MDTKSKKKGKIVMLNKEPFMVKRYLDLKSLYDYLNKEESASDEVKTAYGATIDSDFYDDYDEAKVYGFYIDGQHVFDDYVRVF